MVFTTEDIVYLHHLKNVLEAKGIECVVKNDRMLSISGEIPMVNCWPELWVTDSLYENWANELIANSQKDYDLDDSEDQWRCVNCGEIHSSRFTDCWNCQSNKAF